MLTNVVYPEAVLIILVRRGALPKYALKDSTSPLLVGLLVHFC